MRDNGTPTTPRPVGIFLSHAHEDRAFVRRLAADLTTAGARVWVDEAEMRVGDPLEKKITDAISDMDYLGVVISRHSSASDWVRREIKIALDGEIAGQTVKVLPLLLRGGELPEAIRGKLYADFTSELTYRSSLERILDRLGVANTPECATDRLSELSATSALLRGALEELRSDGISNATADALLSSTINDFDLSEFLSLVAREVEGQKLFGLALTIVPCIDVRGVGHEALDYCLLPGKLEAWQSAYVGMHMQDVKSIDAIRWCHSRLTAAIRNDPYYHSFLVRHADIVLDQCFDEMAAYLLLPNRGPGNYNLDSFEIVVSRAADPDPFKRRWLEWLDDGYFGREHKEGSEACRRLYLLLNDHWGEARFVGLTDATNARVHYLMKSSSKDTLRDGLHHLVAMVDATYLGSGHVLEETIARVYDVPTEWQELFDVSRSGLEAVAQYADNPSPVQQTRVRACLHAIFEADRGGVTGYWRS